ncbi:TerC family protein [Paenibacillus sp. NFR01]|uniref:TerC family protein n=1 Tax=Paenibacillus sp. NFR01 TaxID=1566279 RepID=UPI0008B4BA0E|nr:TerC family protein [Paenibacillus sp. NFR01]SET64799.1 integral membrane protein, YjbE family [Paenibacillus sp. NFR01]
METLLLLGEILMINLVLSGDNAMVIAMASKNLPEKHRKTAVWWGAAGAVLLRCAMTFAAVVLLKIPFIQAGGGVLLLWIAFKLLIDEEEEITVRDSGSSIWKSVRTILIADFIMSLDNVLAIAGLAQGDLALIVIGIAISIPIVVWGSGIIAKWLHRYPVLIYLGAYILAYTAGDMLLQDAKFGMVLSFLLPAFHTMLPVALGVAVVATGALKRKWASVD